MEHHGAALHLLTKNEGLVKQLKKDFTQAELSAKDRMMLDYAAMLTRKPTAVTESVLTDLRKAGITDREMLDLCQITAYFNFVNRMAEGLQVELEDEYK